MKSRDRRHRPSQSAKQVGLTRYRAEDWSRWLETVDDPDQMHDSHADWLRDVTAMADRLRQAGLEVIWVDVEPDSFSQWCRDRGISNDTEAQSRYAAEQIGNLPSPNTPG